MSPAQTFKKVLTQGVRSFWPYGHPSPTLGMTDSVWPLPEAGVRHLAGARAEDVAGLRHTPTGTRKSTRGGGGGSCKMPAAQDSRRITHPFSWRPRWSWFASRAWRSLVSEREHRIGNQRWSEAWRVWAGVRLTHTESPVSSVLGQPHAASLFPYSRCERSQMKSGCPWPPPGPLGPCRGCSSAGSPAPICGVAAFDLSSFRRFVYLREGVGGARAHSKGTARVRASSRDPPTEQGA